MIDRIKCKRMLVSDYPSFHFQERIVIEEFHEGGCLYVHDKSEKDFLDGRSYHVNSGPYCKPIPEKKTRPMTTMEMLMLDREKGPIMYRFKCDSVNKFCSIGASHEDSDWSQCEYKLPDGSVHDCTKEVCK